MNRRWTYPLLVLALVGVALRAETMVERSGLDDAKPVATCSLQTLPERNEDAMRQPMVLYSLQPPPENPLENYERTPLGDWRMPASVDRNDPWLRLLLLDPKRPVVIDLAVFIDGRPFRESREAWIDELLRPADGNKVAATEGTKPAEAASEVDSASGEKQAAEQDANKTADDVKVEEEAETKADAKSKDEDPSATVSKDADAKENDAESKDDKVDDSDDEKKDDTKPVQVPGVAAQARKAPAMAERLRNYLTAGGGAVEREEIRWLIAEWGSGPPVLLLGPSLSWQRAGLAPLLAYLDREQDGGLSVAEIAAAAESLRRADIDADDVLDTNELRRAADRPAVTPFDTEHSMLVELDSQTDWDALAATMERIYPAESGVKSAGTPVRELSTKPADVSLRVDFNTTESKTSGVSIVAVSSELGDAGRVVAATKDVVTLDIGADYIEFSAAQVKNVDKADVAGTQVAIGAAIDGNPLLRLLDRDNDGRLTTRERQELTGMLSALDRDGDGAVGAGEMPLPVRFAVTLGPHVHQLLATPVGSARTITPRESAPAAPAWFASMDKNHDGDLSRGEFLGNREQFKQIDADGDGLVSIAEALKVNPGQ